MRSALIFLMLMSCSGDRHSPPSAAEAEQELLSCVQRGGEWIDCQKFEPRQRWQGVWYTGFEESGFISGVESVPLIRSIGGPASEFDTSLEIDEADAHRRVGILTNERCPHAIRIEFIGQKAIIPRPKIRTGTLPDVVVVDRLISAKLLGKVRTRGLPGYDAQCATPAPSDAEIRAMDAAEWQRCRAAGQCFSRSDMEAIGEKKK